LLPPVPPPCRNLPARFPSFPELPLAFFPSVGRVFTRSRKWAPARPLSSGRVGNQLRPAPPPRPDRVRSLVFPGNLRASGPTTLSLHEWSATWATAWGGLVTLRRPPWPPCGPWPAVFPLFPIPPGRGGKQSAGGRKPGRKRPGPPRKRGKARPPPTPPPARSGAGLAGWCFLKKTRLVTRRHPTTTGPPVFRPEALGVRWVARPQPPGAPPNDNRPPATGKLLSFGGPPRLPSSSGGVENDRRPPWNPAPPPPLRTIRAMAETESPSEPPAPPSLPPPPPSF